MDGRTQGPAFWREDDAFEVQLLSVLGKCDE